MILADKIIRLRKRNGWSQEELAEKMNVSRQAVSKWEGAQTIPDLDKILLLGKLFNVTTDYLLKDEIEDEEFADTTAESSSKRISIQDANLYLEQQKRASVQIAIATFLCILSPVTLILLGAAGEVPSLGISEKLTGTLGLVALFTFVLCAVPIFIYTGFKNEPFSFLDKNVPFELEYGVKGFVSEQIKQFRATYIRWNIIATCICIFSPLPLIVSAFQDNDLICAIMLAVMIVLAGIGSAIFIIVGVRNGSMQKLLKEGEYTDKEKSRRGLKESVSFVYWGVLTAIYLSWSILCDSWHISWLVFAIGGILFPIVMRACNYIADKINK